MPSVAPPGDFNDCERELSFIRRASSSITVKSGSRLADQATETSDHSREQRTREISLEVRAQATGASKPNRALRTKTTPPWQVLYCTLR
eukprot:3864870-Pyramimonas_sp.AAC.1